MQDKRAPEVATDVAGPAHRRLAALHSGFLAHMRFVAFVQAAQVVEAWAAHRACQWEAVAVRQMEVVVARARQLLSVLRTKSAVQQGDLA
jgi:hypothetical protein